MDSENLVLESWKKENICEKWLGLTCDERGEVISMDLSVYDMKGTISPSIGNITSLQYLNLSSNYLNGSIPESIGNLTSLKYLDLNFNNLVGPVPSSIEKLTSLNYLDLSVNNFLGLIPPSIAELTSLNYLNLKSCGFSGNVPPSFKNLTNLRTLSLGTNRNLTGEISDWLGNFSEITHLDLSMNSFSGPLPPIIGNFTKLETLLLQENGFDSVPESIGNLKNLKILQLDSNNLKGEIPPAIGNLQNLTYLGLKENGLKGSFGETFKNLQNLETLNLAFNFLDRGFPTGIQYFLNLKFLYLDQNFLDDEFPSFLTNMKNLETLSCNDCGLRGKLPETFGKLKNLQILFLVNNSLSGPIPESFGDLKNLDTLDLSYNQLSENLPKSFSKLTKIADLTLSNNNFSGEIPEFLFQYRDIEAIYLQNNFFSGEIPNVSSQNLYVLDLRSNLLTGTIPISISKIFSNLNELRLSNNRLKSSIPFSVGYLSALKVLELNNCSLTGSVPPQLGFLKNLEILDLGDNSLIGGLPENFFTNFSQVQSLDISATSISGKIPNLQYLESLQKLDLSFGQFSEDLPKKFPSNLIEINLANNFLTGNVSSRFETLKLLENLILDNNEFSGDVPVLRNAKNLAIVSLVGNNFKIGIPPSYLNNTEIILDLTGNPICTNSSNSGLSFCSSNSYRSRFLENPVCVDSICPGKTVINPFLYTNSNSCTCSPPVVLFFSINSHSVTVFTRQTAKKMRIGLSDIIGFPTSLIVVKSAFPIPGKGFSVTVQIFARDALPLSPFSVSKILSFLAEDYPGIEIEGVGNILLLNYTLTVLELPEFPVQPPSPSLPPSIQKAGHSSLKVWKIVIISVISIFVLMTCALCFYLFIFIKGDNKYSEFAIQIQEHFVKHIPLSEIRAATENFKEENALGAGAYGTVYRGIATDGVIWAVKRAKTISLKGLEDFQTEVNVISRMSHHNIVRLLGFCDERSEQILVYEFMANGTLKDRIRIAEASGPDYFSLSSRLDALRGAAEGLQYLHVFANPTIIHRDVKSDNILFDENNEAKLADFGLLKDSPRVFPGTEYSEPVETRVAGTPGYIDPEYFQTYLATPKSDVFSFGVVLFEVITGQTALIKTDEEVNSFPSYKALAQWVDSFRPEPLNMVDPRLGSSYNKIAMRLLISLAFKCVERVGDLRPNMDEVCRHLGQIREILRGPLIKQPVYQQETEVDVRGKDKFGGDGLGKDEIEGHSVESGPTFGTESNVATTPSVSDSRSRISGR